MKRINPATGSIFKHGDIREDGYRFVSYNVHKIRENGTYYENWKKAETWKQYTSRDNLENLSLEGLASKILKNAKARSKKKGGKVTITKEWIFEKLKNGKSELTNLPFDLERKKKSLYAPSLDRINSLDRDYKKSNCRLILWGENQALNSADDEEILPILEAMVKAIKKNVKRKQLAQLSKKTN